MKFFGSKSRIAKDIVPIIQRYINDNDIHYYLEPFAGGCNCIDKIKCDRKFAYDIDKYLIYLLIHVKEGYKLYDDVDRELYNRAREAWKNNNKDREFENWQIGCIEYLASYAARDFTGGFAKPGWEHTKKGDKFRNYYQEAKANLISQSQTKGFQDIMFGISDYRDLHMEKQDVKYVIYCDPSYKSTKRHGNSLNFDYDEFWDIMRLWSQKHIVLISELEAPDDFECIWQKSVSRSIKARDKSRATENLFKLKA